MELDLMNTKITIEHVEVNLTIDPEKSQETISLRDEYAKLSVKYQQREMELKDLLAIREQDQAVMYSRGSTIEILKSELEKAYETSEARSVRLTNLQQAVDQFVTAKPLRILQESVIFSLEAVTNLRSALCDSRKTEEPK